MKQTSIALLTLAAALLAAGCQKENIAEQKVFTPMTISAVAEGISTPTKTGMAFKYDIVWAGNDKIYVEATGDNTCNDTFSIASESIGKTVGTFTQDGETDFLKGQATCDVKAYYPSSMVSGNAFTWPANQTYSPESAQIIPMYGEKTLCSTDNQTFSMKSLGSVLQIVFTTPATGVTLQSIEIKDDEKTMSGGFEVDTDGKANITATDKAGIILDLGDGVAVGLKAKYFNIAVPAGNYQNLTLIFTAKNGRKCTMTGGAINIAHNVVGRLTLTGKEFKIPGALSGVFSVSDNDGTTVKQVYFSKGNLWADNSNALHFETNQYDFNSNYEASHVSHFTWSDNITSAVGTSYNGSNLFCDKNNKVSVDGSEAIYYALTTKEWQYLFNTRTVNGGTGAGKSYSLNITYGKKMGLVLYPDDYTGAPLSGTVTDLPDGVVFLPAAGRRYGSLVRNVGDSGYYWSSSAFDVYLAYFVYFYSDLVFPGNSDRRDGGVSVRLITESE